jgi:ATP-binding cassette, subfamily C, bacterial CydC
VTHTLGRLVALAGVPRWRLALSLLLGALAVAFGIALLATAGYLISRAAEQPPILSLTVTIVVVRFLGLARPIARYLDRLASHDLALRALGRTRARFYERIEPLAPAQLAGYRRGDLLARMVGDVDALQGLYLRGLGPPLVAAVVGGASVAVCAVLLPVAGLVLSAGLVLAGVAVPILAAVLAGSTCRRQGAARGALTAELVELLRGAPELAAFGQEERTLARVRDLDRDLARLGRRDAMAAGVGDALSILVAGLTLVGVLAAAVSAHDTSGLDRVLMATLALLALSSFDAVAGLPGAARELSATLASGRRVLELTDREPVVRDPAEPLPPPPRRATVELRGVTARYEGSAQPALTGVDLRLDPGKRVALVGPSGAGKTTVTSLLVRFLDPEHGSVTIDGRDVREYRQADVRRQFALAGQEAHVFDTTIRENLLIGRPTASASDLEQVLRRARLGDWVASLPDGLDTFVGEEGTRLSGGQRQRLTLARALLADAPVLVLDEPTAHVDPATARSLIGDLLDAAGDRTVLLITHGAEGLERVDEVVRLDAGARVQGPSPATSSQLGDARAHARH